MKKLSLLLLTFILGGLVVVPGLSRPQRVNERQAIEAEMQAYARDLRSGTPAEVAAHFTKDGELLLPGTDTLHGREAIRNFLTPLAGAVEVEAVTITTDLIEASGASATQWGAYKQVAGERGKEKQTYTGRYAALWHQEDGHWRLAKLLMQPK
ncbi:MAG: SgcJ/EcaC family oxidoreductase [Acidobacteria bacterium]|nr:SgcJ/EcaC family oxidoreductase [Acidobacteriota bacterium]MBI3421673.1 SgcJ/EcaC family oxidoreductase [Acidobacteriota bacterium]